MKKALIRLVIAVIVGLIVLIGATFLQMTALNRKAGILIERSDSLVLGCSKADAVAAMPGDLLVSTNPPTADEVDNGIQTAVSALRYNAPVLLNSVYVILVFDENDRLIGKKRVD